ncbi:MAG: thiamine diphosphokinase [Myxococcota bacterium]
MRRLTLEGLDGPDAGKRALILANGAPPTVQRLARAVARASFFVALDGAGQVAMRLGLRPDCIIGDLDSVDRSRVEGIPLIQDPDQETNDLEKGLSWLLVRGFTQVHVLGATGKRFDHALKNLSVLKQFNEKISCYFEDEDALMMLLTTEQSAVEIRGQVGQTLSLFPLSGKVEGIQTEGLLYPLHDEPLENGVRDGSSNVLEQACARVRIRAGALLVYLVHVSEDHAWVS